MATVNNVKLRMKVGGIGADETFALVGNVVRLFDSSTLRMLPITRAELQT